ncbi:hypothetical protein VTJ49DRAFT_1212 [Mycothermus thermophilus]|uniref:DUF4045 domain-containing protein n=1 Tax=Humicola insolens TaxID=85995 RepID=A0ABR3VF40_HUMIN
MSDEVSDFLRSVELLKERREEETEARSRELEEKILQEKKERQARRLERARSISPQKSSPATTPTPTPNRVGILSSTADGTNLESPGLGGHESPSLSAVADPSDSPTKENDSPFDSDTKRASMPPSTPSIAMPSARAGLSWQRRPTSSDRPKSRPLSMVAAENAARNTPTTTESAAEQTPSREQIAQALASKDPSWFRQTQDPGRGSGAFRKSQVEDQDTVDLPSARTQLPGLSQSPASEPQKETSRPETPTTSPSKVGSPLLLAGAPRLDPPAADSIEAMEQTSPKSQPQASPGRTSPTRPLSPTKGMGGFVQSAMMKRSDSVKRWSVSSPSGLQRADTIRTSTTSLDGVSRPTTPKTSVRPKSMFGLSTEPMSTSTNDEKEPEPEEHTSASKSAVPAAAKTTDEEKTTPPVSPSKTMDPRRWSPTKGSWLEAALNKPESPKAKAEPKGPAQPAWMVELNKAKAQKASADLARSASLAPKKPEVKTGGLMRSTPMGAELKPSALTGLPTLPSVPTTEKPAIAALRGTLRKTSPAAESSAESQADAAAVATKPDAPPKPDFRANLKPRAPPPESATTNPADELKSVFGTLRKTKPEKYVAPDELKDNILRGKAGLHNTGGPKKTERVDEFKEAILKKKDEFNKAKQEGRTITHTREPSSVGTATTEKSVPEGIAKRLELQRTGTLRQTPTTAEFPPQTGVQKEVAPPSSNTPVSRQKSMEGLGRVGGKVGGLAERFNPALAGLIARGPPPAGGPKSLGSGGAATSSKADDEPAGPGPQLTHLTKNRARGPKRKAPSSAPSAVKETQASAPAMVSQTEKTVAARPETKTFPFSKPEEAVPSPQPEPAKSERPVISPKPSRYAAAPLETSSAQSGQLPKGDSKPLAEAISLVDSSRRLPKEEEAKSPGQPVSSVESKPVKPLTRSRTKSVHETVAALTALSLQSSPKPEPAEPSSPKKLDLKRMSKFLDDASQPSPGLEPAKSSSRSSSPVKDRSNSIRSRPASPVKDRFFPGLESPALGKQPVNEPTEPKPVPLAIRRQPTGGNGLGLGLSNVPAPVKAVQDERPLPVPPKSERPLPAPPRSERPLPAPPIVAASPPPATSPRRVSPVRSRSKSISEDVTALIDSFFAPSRSARRAKYTTDTTEMLMRRPGPSTARVQTQRTQLFLFTAEGKKASVASHHERVLFEREMYLCPHTFLDASGRRVDEVYFWVGDEVPVADVQDATLFAAREARAYGGRLVKLQQGKETSEFLQALGGIVTVRRGSSNKYDSLAPTMLCARRYLGQVAFDEVDFSPVSLCSGFPYLVAHGGKCFLWKGKGSNVEELGCARLVGMDLAPTGDLVEVDEGAEPEGFWRVFEGGDGNGNRFPSADHWRLKPSYDKYCCRLFVASAGDKGEAQITEISPFTQLDLSPSHIYVLDAFFELYILVGARSQSLYPAFRNALDFAQEYAILAAGIEDRPFVPVSTVVLEGIPRDLKAVFRKWSDARSPTIMHPSSSGSGSGSTGGSGGGGGSTLKRGRSLRIVPLTQALQALGGSE